MKILVNFKLLLLIDEMLFYCHCYDKNFIDGFYIIGKCYYVK